MSDTETPYHFIVIGSGPAGWVAARAAAAFGARVALVERTSLGGEGFLSGSIPYQAFRTAVLGLKSYGGSSNAEGVNGGAFAACRSAARAASQRVAARISANELAGTGVDLIRADARFMDDRNVAIGNRIHPLTRVLIATGSRAIIPPVAGLPAGRFLLPEQLADLPELPPRVAVIGGGTRGVETAQCLARLGSQVTLYERNQRLLLAFPAEIEGVIRRQLIADGIEVRLACHAETVAGTDAGYRVSGVSASGAYADEQIGIVVAAGRSAEIDSLNLPAARIEVAGGLILTNDVMQTTNRRVYAAGDVCTAERSVHAARAQARLVVANALFFGRERVSSLPIPVCLHTDPGAARIGAQADGSPGLRALHVMLREVDAELTGEHPDGFVEIVHDRSGTIRGAAVVSRSAASLIGELALAIHHRLKLSASTSALHVFGTSGEAFRHAADLYRRSLLTPFTTSLLRRVAQLRR